MQTTTHLTGSAVDAEGTTCEQAAAIFANANDQFVEHLSAIDPNLLTAEGVQQHIADFANTEAAKQVDTIENAAVERVDQAAARVKHLERELSPDRDTAAEIRGSRYWESTRRILDAIDDPSRLTGVVDDLITKADRPQLGVLLQELLPFLQSRVEAIPNVPPAHRDKMLEGYRSAIEHATGKAVPEYSKARKQLKLATQAHHVIRQNASSLRDQFRIAAPGAYRRPMFIDAGPYDPDK